MKRCSHGPKVAFRTRRKARKGRMGPGKKRTYRCPYCGYWHNTSEEIRSQP